MKLSSLSEKNGQSRVSGAGRKQSEKYYYMTRNENNQHMSTYEKACYTLKAEMVQSLECILGMGNPGFDP